MRFLIEMEHRTIAPYVIEADTQEDALEILKGNVDGDVLPGDPIAQPITVMRITALGD